MMPFDGFLRSKNRPVADFWRIDVEGAELFVLRAASQHFAAGRRSMIFAEVHARFLEPDRGDYRN